MIEALILYVTSLLFRYHDVTSRIWQICGLIIRLCYQAGYHRDPSQNPRFSAFDCEMRRRTWMVARELETSVSCCIGRIGSVDSRLCDTEPPANLLDTDFSPTHCSPPRSAEECTLVQVEICFSRLVYVMGDIAVSSYSISKPSTVEVRALSDRLETARNELPQKLRMIPLDQCLVDSAIEVVDRLRLELVYQRALCILYHRFLGNPNFEREHQTCVRAAEAIVRHSISMLEAAQPGGQLAFLRIMLFRHVHEFNLAAMILCSELKRDASSAKNPVLHSKVDPNIRSLLLRACNLWKAPDIPSSKARVALDAVVAFLKANEPREIRPERQWDDPGVLVEEILPDDVDIEAPSMDSFDFYDSVTLSEIAPDGFLNVNLSGLDLFLPNHIE